MEPGQNRKVAALTFNIYVHFFYERVDNMYEKFMLEAIQEAKIAFSEGEIPIGAVLVYDQKVISRGHNTRIQDSSVLGHAEMNVLKNIAKKTGNWRLNECDLYVTMIPCPMCASAINQARIRRVICGTIPNDTNYSQLIEILSDHKYGNPVEILTGVLEDECSELLKKFFQKKRT